MRRIESDEPTGVGVPLGVIAGYRHNSFADLGTTFGSLVGVSMPIFWLALMLLRI